MKKCHEMEKYMTNIIERNVHWILQDREIIPTPIEKLYLWSEQGIFCISGSLIVGNGKRHSIVHGYIPKTTMPIYSDDEDAFLVEFCKKYEDKEAFLREFREKHGSDLGWGDYNELPESLYRMETIIAAHKVADTLATNGISFVANAKVGISIDGEFYCDPSYFEWFVQDRLSKFSTHAKNEFLSIYYELPEACHL